MDYEKKYKDALERARNIRFGNPSSATANVVCEEIFPELKKSEDEKIRIFINNSLCFIPDVVWENNNVTKEELIAWLEKQGEKKPADKVEPKFKVGDWVVHDMSDGRKDIRQIIGMTNKSYILDCENFNTFYFNDLENDYHLWTIEDAKDGDVLIYPVDNGKILIFIYESLCESFDGEVYAHALLDGDDYFSGSVGSVCCKFMDILKPATKEQRDLLFQKMKEAGYEWDSDKKVLVMIGVDNDEEDERYEELIEDNETSIKQNPAWSDEDEKILGKCIDAASGYYSPEDKQSMKDWLESFKNRVQPQWKPTEKQLGALLDCVNLSTKENFFELNSLYTELVKL